MQTSDWISLFGDLINLAVAICAAVAARAAWDSANASRLAVDHAHQAAEESRKEAEESRRVAEESRKIAQEQTKAFLTAAKANALASRIEFYNEQIRPLLQGNADLPQLRQERDHLAYWLDRQTDALGVGLNHQCPGSPYNAVIKTRNERAGT